MGLSRVRIKLLRPASFADLAVLVFLVAVVYAVVGVAGVWTSPYRPTTEIHLTLGSLVGYSLLSLSRVVLAYFCSLAFTLGYGYLAAKSRRLEPILISILDILQSVPVLGFMPGLVLSLVALFPSSNAGLEIAAILMIFSGQAWNMVFSFYSSLKSVPTEWRDMAEGFRLKPLQVLRSVELPFAANGLLWNSMLSVAGGWFFLMTIESFSLGERSFRLAGIGSYMAVAHEKGDWSAVTMGIVMMFLLIIVVDRCLWAPLVVWSERFKFQAKREEGPTRSVVLDLLMRSDLLSDYFSWLDRQRKRMARRLEERVVPITRGAQETLKITPPSRRSVQAVAILFFAIAVSYGGMKFYTFVSATNAESWVSLLRDTFYTLIRVIASVVIGSLWTIPVGVWIGTNPKWTRRLQPVVQVVAAFPFPMIFPLIALLMVRLGISMSIGAVVLLLLSSQWYILFNVISGASQIPAIFMEVAESYQVKGVHYWKAVLWPALFPSLVNGWVTAAGGSWNACIVAEYVRVGEVVQKAPGIGAAITVSAETANFALLASAITMLVVTVVLINRFIWGSLYYRAETRYRVDLG